MIRLQTFAPLALLSALALAAGACSGSRSSAPTSLRPTVNESAVETLGPDALADGGLGFMDALESRPLASTDDAVHAILLLSTGSSGKTYEERLAMAKELGYLPKTFDRLGRQAITIGEVSQMAQALLTGKLLEVDDATSALSAAGINPPGAQSNMGLTGAQLVSLIGNIQDAMSAAGIQRVAPPVIQPPAPISADPAPVAVAQSPELPATSAVAATITPMEPALPEVITEANASLISAARQEAPKTAPLVVENEPAAAPIASTPASPAPATNLKGREEPLPEIPLGAPAPAIEVQETSGKPAIIGPSGEVTGSPASKPRPGVKLSPMPPAPTKPGDKKPADAKKTGKVKPLNRSTDWVTGQPLDKPSSTAAAEESK